MADNTKQEFQYLDIPDGNGGEARWWCNDSEARAMIKPTASVAEVHAALAELT